MVVKNRKKAFFDSYVMDLKLLSGLLDSCLVFIFAIHVSTEKNAVKFINSLLS